MELCLFRVIDVGEGAPPVISSVTINGESYPVDNVSVRNTSELVIALNKIKQGFLVTQTESSTIITFNNCTDEQISIIADSTEYELQKGNCRCCSDCISELIGLKTVCETPECKLWVNDIGIDRRFIEQIITSDFKGVSDFFDSQRRLAQKDITGMIHSYMMPKYYVSSVISEGKIGFVDGGYKNPEGTWQGVHIMMDDSDYMTYISKVGVSVNYTGSVAICAFDTETGEMISSNIVEAIAGTTIKVPVKILLNRNSIFIGYQSAGQHRATKLSRDLCCGKKSKTCSTFKISGAYGELDSLNTTDSTGGLILEYSVSCDHESWICRNANALILPMFYRVAQNIYQFALTHSKHNRINSSVTVNSEQMERSLEWATEKFNQSMNDAMKGLKLPNNRCFNCNEFARSVLSLP